MSGLRFYLGTHMPHWLALPQVEARQVPLFISHMRLMRYRRALPRARTRWALDSGGFSQISMHGRWTFTAAEYAAAVRRYRDEIGGLDWAAPMDWMCEPPIIAKTGLSVAEHQRRTVASFLTLRQLAPDLPFIPVIQGWSTADYLRCVDLYQQAGVDLWSYGTVGVGSVCRRQGTHQAREIMGALASLGLRLHGFGYKKDGLAVAGGMMVSADSMAWSYNARRQRGRPLPGCTGHQTCANCRWYALRWYRQMVRAARIGTSAPWQMSMAA